MKLASVFLTFLALAAACGSSDGGTMVDGMTFEEVELRVRAALFPPGAVMHTTETYERYPRDRLPAPVEIWRDIDANEGRVGASSEEVAPVVFTGGRRYALPPDGVLHQSEVASLFAAYELLGSAGGMPNAIRDKIRMKRVDLDGVAAIRIKLQGQGIDSTPRPTYLYASASDFLPIKHEGPQTSVRFAHERLTRGALPADFFSPDSVRAVAATVPSPPAVWRSLGRDVFWLGPEFAGLTPAVGTSPSPGLDANTPFTIGYEMRNGDTCSLSILHRQDLVPPLPFPAEQRATARGPIGEFTIYEGASEWGAWHRRAGDGIVNVIASCDGGGAVSLRSVAGMTLVVETLRPYDGPALMVDFIALTASPENCASALTFY